MNFPIVRFAPSPTGFLHIGGARTALFNYLFAKNQNGKFLLRIEDTDKKRSTKEAVDAIIDGLSWLGLRNDDKIIYQSQNLYRHKEIAYSLLEKDQAYYCYTQSEELEELRKKAEQKGEIFRFQSPWRNKINSQTSSIKPVIRIKSPIIGHTIINDLVQGEVRVENCEIDDFVILRSDETPTYMLAVVVDDFDMKITHIIRGDDHLTNAFKQKIIYQAMGWNIPHFAHIPLIYGSDGAKMSKRHGATSVTEYKEMGYLPEALRNYLLRLGWSHQNDEIISDENAIKWFNLENVGKSPARFDFAKLDNLNKHYIKAKSEEELFDLMKPWFEYAISSQSQIKIIKAIKFLKERAVVMCDLLNYSKVYIEGFNKKIDENDLKILESKKSLLREIRNIINSIDIWDHDNINECINNFCLKNNLKIKDFGPALRIALTFSSSSPGGIFDVIEILGKDEILKRIEI